MNIKNILGEQIKRLRKSRNLTQEQFAEMIEIAPRNLSRVELGENFVTADTLEKIILALNVSASELFDYEHLKDSEILLNEIYQYIETFKSDKNQLEKVYCLIRLVKNNNL